MFCKYQHVDRSFLEQCSHTSLVFIGHTVKAFIVGMYLLFCALKFMMVLCRFQLEGVHWQRQNSGGNVAMRCVVFMSSFIPSKPKGFLLSWRQEVPTQIFLGTFKAQARHPPNKRERNPSFSPLIISTTTESWGISNSSIMSLFVQVAELTKMFLEAKDNVKFLTTLERHFKVRQT